MENSHNKKKLYLVTDSSYHTEKSFLYTVEQAAAGGVSMIQLREKDKTAREYMNLAEKVKKITDAYNIPLLIDDRVDVAFAVKASGVHVGKMDIPVREARKMLGPDKIIGATAKTVEQALEAERQGADYLGVGAIYPTPTKVKTVLTSVSTLQDICKAVSIPVYAIGGLNASNISVLKGVPIEGVCAVSAIMKAENPKEVVEHFSRELECLF